MPFTTSPPSTIEVMFSLFERDFPLSAGFDWMAGSCACGDADGPYLCNIRQRGKVDDTVLIVDFDLANGRVERSHPRSGHWSVQAHGHTLLEACHKAFGLALEQEH